MTDMPLAGPGRAQYSTRRLTRLCIRSKGWWDDEHCAPGDLGLCDVCLEQLRANPVSPA